jgi:hypothetical protein
VSTKPAAMTLTRMGASSQDQVGSLGAGAPGRLEADTRAAADHDDGLSGELRFAAHVDLTFVTIASRARAVHWT